MKYLIIALFCVAVFAGVASDEGDFLITADVLFCTEPYPPVTPPDVITYDDGSAYWITWEGQYRGVYFLPDEFYYPHLGCLVEGAEFWFYHHTSYPWDTSQFYSELWEGDLLGPMTNLHSFEVTATHYSAVTDEFPPDIWGIWGFWIIENTELSAGGWPSLLGDNSPNFTGEPRSFSSIDFIIWEPWLSGEASVNMESISKCSWGAIKTLF